MNAERHKYEYKVNPNSAAAKIIRMVGGGKRVLELGSGPGSITRHLKDNHCRVTALELDSKAIEIVSEYCEKVYPCDLNSPSWFDILSDHSRFEVIVAGDVLEHLYDPWVTLRALHPLLADDGYAVVSLPHVGHSAVLSCLLRGDFEYQPWGLLDRTHIRFFGIRNIQRLFEDAGFKIVEVDFVIKNPEQTEFAIAWRQLSDQARQAIGENPFGNIYQIVIKAVPLAAPGKALIITDVLIPPFSEGAYSSGARGSRFLGFLLSFLSLRTREKIARWAEKIGFRP